MLSRYLALPSIEIVGLGPLQPIGPVEGRELAALDGVHDLGRAEPMDRLVQRFDAEVGFQRVR